MKKTSIKGTLLAVLALTIVSTAAMTQPALADYHRGPPPRFVRHDDAWRRHEAEMHHWHGPHYVEEPGVVYAPPPVVYSQPEPSPGINLIVPLHIR